MGHSGSLPSLSPGTQDGLLPLELFEAHQIRWDWIVLRTFSASGGCRVRQCCDVVSSSSCVEIVAECPSVVKHIKIKEAAHNKTTASASQQMNQVMDCMMHTLAGTTP